MLVSKMHFLVKFWWRFPLRVLTKQSLLNYLALPSVPNYTDGVYDSQLVKVTETEKKLYPFVAAEKKHKPIRDVLLSITDLIKNPYVVSTLFSLGDEYVRY